MYLVYGALSPCTLVRAGERLAASFMNLKGHCTQIHSTTSELRVVDPETANGNERFRKKRVTPGDRMYRMYRAVFPTLNQLFVFHV